MVPPSSEVRLYVVYVGAVALDEAGRLMGFKPLPDKPDAAAQAMLGWERGELIEPVKELIAELIDQGVKMFLLENAALAPAARKEFAGEDVVFEETRSIPVNVDKVLVEAGFLSSIEEYREVSRRVSDAILVAKLRAAAGRRDLMIVHAVNALEDLDKGLNMLYSRCRDWYGVHFPEAQDLISDMKDYFTLISGLSLRERMNQASLSDALGEKDYLSRLLEAARASVGASLSGEDADQIARLASEGLRLASLRANMEDYIKRLMERECSNLCSVAGPLLGAKLVSLAGGLKRLARMPSSTVQVLGAEKALFRFFKTGKGAPKHGVIFQHPHVHGAPRWQRGKIARILASKISIAARVDFYSEEDRSDELKRSLEKRVEEIKQKYAEPTPRARVERGKGRRSRAQK